MKGNLPGEFVWVRGHHRIVLVHASMQRTLGRTLLTAAHGPPDGAQLLAGGRGSTYRVTLDDGQVVALRLCRRGGLLGGVLRDLYWGLRQRPFEEVAVTEEARRRGVPAVEAVGARVDRLRGGWYRGIVATRYLDGVVPLWGALVAAPAGERTALAQSAGQLVRAMCEAKVLHPDLHLGNCLVRRGAAGVETFAVDLDRARMVDAWNAAALWERLIERIERSARKLDPRGEVLTPEVLRVLSTASRPEG